MSKESDYASRPNAEYTEFEVRCYGFIMVALGLALGLLLGSFLWA